MKRMAGEIKYDALAASQSKISEICGFSPYPVGTSVSLATPML
jgi:hypothetical protein